MGLYAIDPRGYSRVDPAEQWVLVDVARWLASRYSNRLITADAFVVIPPTVAAREAVELSHTVQITSADGLAADNE